MFLTISLYASLASALVNPGFIILFQIPCWSRNSLSEVNVLAELKKRVAEAVELAKKIQKNFEELGA